MKNKEWREKERHATKQTKSRVGKLERGCRSEETSIVTPLFRIKVIDREPLSALVFFVFKLPNALPSVFSFLSGDLD